MSHLMHTSQFYSISPSKDYTQYDEKLITGESKDEEKNLTYFGIQLKSQFSLKNLLAIPMVYLITATLTNYGGMQSVFLLQSEDYFNISQEHLGKVMTDIIFYQQLIQISTVLFIGYFFDVLGRRITLGLTLSIAGGLFYLQTQVSPSVVLLILVRAGTAICINGPYSSPLIPDYVKKNSRGKASSVQAFGYVLGDLMATLVLFQLTKDLDYSMAFGISSIFILVMTLLLVLLITEPKTKNLSKLFYQSKNSFNSLKIISKEVFSTVYSNPAIQICLIGTLLNRNVGLIMGTYVTIWVASFVNGETLRDTNEAKDIIQQVSVICILIKIISFYFVGVLTDRLPSFVTIPTTYAVRMIGIIALMLCSSPKSILFYVAYSVTELGNLMQNITVEAAFAKNLPKEIRGSLNSLQFFIGSLGLLIFAKITGELYENGGQTIPYLIIASCDFMFIVIVVMYVVFGKFRQ